MKLTLPPLDEDEADVATEPVGIAVTLTAAGAAVCWFAAVVALFTAAVVC